MTNEERELDLMVAELETENKLMRARNERLEKELEAARDDAARLKAALARILAISDLAFRDSSRQRVGEVCTTTGAVPRQATGLL